MNVWDYIKSKLNPVNIAVKCGDITYSYGRLEAIVDEVSAALFSDIKINRVAVCCSDKFCEAIAILAALRAGRIVIPIAVNYGQKHIGDIISHCNPDVLITDEEIRPYIIALHSGEHAVKTQTREKKRNKLAFIIYTSGTTGKPKGVMLTHKNIIFNIKNIAEFIKYSPEDRMLIARPQSHIAVLVGELLVGLYSGLQIQFINESFNPKRLTGQIIEQKITVLNATPTMLKTIAISLHNREEELPLKKVVVSGEVLTKETAVHITDRMPDVSFYAAYGLTEAAPRVSMGEIVITDAEHIAQGEPLPGVSVKLKCGKLYVKSPGVMRGYYKDQRLTLRRKKFGWFDTKDSAGIDHLGRLIIRGRADEMIIRAGVNIYPQEVESILLTDPRVKECMAYGKTEISLKVVTGLDKQNIYALCREILPQHLVPNRIEVVEAIEKTPSGKVRRG